VIYKILKKNDSGEFQRETGEPVCSSAPIFKKYMETPSIAPVDIRETITRYTDV
jgi:hypothetical protein